MAKVVPIQLWAPGPPFQEVNDKTAYEVLGVSETATPEAIQQRFIYTLAKQGPIARAAFDLLSDPHERASYDAWLKGKGRPPVDVNRVISELIDSVLEEVVRDLRQHVRTHRGLRYLGQTIIITLTPLGFFWRFGFSTIALKLGELIVTGLALPAAVVLQFVDLLAKVALIVRWWFVAGSKVGMVELGALPRQRKYYYALRLVVALITFFLVAIQGNKGIKAVAAIWMVVIVVHSFIFFRLHHRVHHVYKFADVDDLTIDVNLAFACDKVLNGFTMNLIVWLTGPFWVVWLLLCIIVDLCDKKINHSSDAMERYIAWLTDHVLEKVTANIKLWDEDAMYARLGELLRSVRDRLVAERAAALQLTPEQLEQAQKLLQAFMEDGTTPSVEVYSANTSSPQQLTTIVKALHAEYQSKSPNNDREWENMVLGFLESRCVATRAVLLEFARQLSLKPGASGSWSALSTLCLSLYTMENKTDVIRDGNLYKELNRMLFTADLDRARKWMPYVLALARVPAEHRSTPIYRGMVVANGPLLTDTDLFFAQPLSFTTTRKTAEKFSQRDEQQEEEGCTSVVLVCNEGASGAAISEISAFPSEAEFLVLPFSVWKVTDRSWKSKHEMEVELTFLGYLGDSERAQLPELAEAWQPAVELRADLNSHQPAAILAPRP
eukprot:TRINITY_DN11526_c0_g1_i1.p1 TRINITY_DN11526_c0_g1~~TRINITY_DN11526_c0_g1_i1.p1  ORF type:complete len:665 (+),score=173.85 TRINITY_DN11526_c0_g1_i1:69-2063(+)